MYLGQSRCAQQIPVAGVQEAATSELVALQALVSVAAAVDAAAVGRAARVPAGLRSFRCRTRPSPRRGW